MENDITANPDYQLIMSFLKSIRPGDMSDEAATQLKMIGERIQSGGSLSDQEREMFQSVMGAMPQSSQWLNVRRKLVWQWIKVRWASMSEGCKCG
jgi:hypothetical protein